MINCIKILNKINLDKKLIFKILCNKLKSDDKVLS